MKSKSDPLIRVHVLGLNNAQYIVHTKLVNENFLTQKYIASKLLFPCQIQLPKQFSWQFHYIPENSFVIDLNKQQKLCLDQIFF